MPIIKSPKISKFDTCMANLAFPFFCCLFDTIHEHKFAILFSLERFEEIREDNQCELLVLLSYLYLYLILYFFLYIPFGKWFLCHHCWFEKSCNMSSRNSILPFLLISPLIWLWSTQRYCMLGPANRACKI